MGYNPARLSARQVAVRKHMQKNKLPLLLGLLLAGIITVWLLPSMLRSLPTRYAMRLPLSLIHI